MDRPVVLNIDKCVLYDIYDPETVIDVANNNNIETKDAEHVELCIQHILWICELLDAELKPYLSHENIAFIIGKNGKTTIETNSNVVFIVNTMVSVNRSTTIKFNHNDDTISSSELVEDVEENFKRLEYRCNGIVEFSYNRRHYDDFRTNICTNLCTLIRTSQDLYPHYFRWNKCNFINNLVPWKNVNRWFGVIDLPINIVAIFNGIMTIMENDDMIEEVKDDLADIKKFIRTCVHDIDILPIAQTKNKRLYDTNLKTLFKCLDQYLSDEKPENVEDNDNEDSDEENEHEDDSDEEHEEDDDSDYVESDNEEDNSQEFRELKSLVTESRNESVATSLLLAKTTYNLLPSENKSDICQSTIALLTTLASRMVLTTEKEIDLCYELCEYIIKFENLITFENLKNNDWETNRIIINHLQSSDHKENQLQTWVRQMMLNNVKNGITISNRTLLKVFNINYEMNHFKNINVSVGALNICNILHRDGIIEHMYTIEYIYNKAYRSRRDDTIIMYDDVNSQEMHEYFIAYLDEMDKREGYSYCQVLFNIIVTILQIMLLLYFANIILSYMIDNYDYDIYDPDYHYDKYVEL